MDKKLKELKEREINDFVSKLNGVCSNGFSNGLDVYNYLKTDLMKLANLMDEIAYYRKEIKEGKADERILKAFFLNNIEEISTEDLKNRFEDLYDVDSGLNALAYLMPKLSVLNRIERLLKNNPNEA